MAWTEAKRRRGGRRLDIDDQRQRDLRGLAQEIKQALFRAPAAQRRTEWHCQSCSTPNFEDRRCCRRCGANQVQARHSSRPASTARAPRIPRSSPSTQSCSQAAPSSVASADAPASDQRRAAPEKRVADAEARAAALESAAATFRSGGLDGRAKELEDEAAAIRKKEAQAPPPGRRLDLAAAYAERAATRATKACEAVAVAEAAVEEAIKARDVAQAESEEAAKQLASLRAELAAAQPQQGGSAEAVADAEAISVGQIASDALARARTAVQAVEWAPLTLRVYALPTDVGAAIFAGREAPAIDSPLDAPTSFLVQDALQKFVREAAVASARAAAAAAAPVAT